MAQTKMITYRYATKDEWEKIYDFAMRAIAETTLPEFAEDAGNHLQHRIASMDEGYVALAEDKDLEEGIVGYIEIDPKRSNKPTHVYIRGIFVLQDYRRLGIGKKLLNMMIERHGSKGQELLVEAFTETGLNFWKSFGFDIQHYALKYKAS